MSLRQKWRHLLSENGSCVSNGRAYLKNPKSQAA